jgi:hypothetical protein
VNVIDDGKLQAAADEAVDRAMGKLSALLSQLFNGLDGWTVTITLNKPKENK